MSSFSEATSRSMPPPSPIIARKGSVRQFCSGRGDQQRRDRDHHSRKPPADIPPRNAGEKSALESEIQAAEYAGAKTRIATPGRNITANQTARRLRCARVRSSRNSMRFTASLRTPKLAIDAAAPTRTSKGTSGCGGSIRRSLPVRCTRRRLRPVISHCVTIRSSAHYNGVISSTYFHARSCKFCPYQGRRGEFSHRVRIIPNLRL